MAYPTLNAETGIVSLPNAKTAQTGSIVGAADVLFSSQTTTGKAQVLYGLSDRAEVGASFSAGVVTGGSVSAKYRFTDDQTTFNLAAGGAFTVATGDDTAVDLYLVGTQAFNIGAASGRSLLGTFGVHFFSLNSDNTLRPFIAAQLPLGNRTQLEAEYQVKGGSLFADPLTSVAIRQKFNPSWSGQAGISNADGFGTSRSYRLFLGALYTFGAGKGH